MRGSESRRGHIYEETTMSEFPRAPRDEAEREACEPGRRTLADYCTGDDGRGYRCGRRPGHAGDHVCAGTGDDTIYARWPSPAPEASATPSTPADDVPE